jgi:hypothetical protein
MNLVLEIRWYRLPGGRGLFLGVVTPLNLEEFNLPSTGHLNHFFKNIDRHFTIGEIVI